MKNFSKICFGCEPLGGTDSGKVDLNDIKKAIYRALDLGVNFFDTAGVYGLGLSEERLSRILGNYRHKVFIATKGGLSWHESNSIRQTIIKDSSPNAIRRDVDSSLTRLRLDCLPIFFIHWPDINTPMRDTFNELSKLQNEGKINSIGCSNFSAKQLNEAIKVAQIDFVQLPLNLLRGGLNKEISDICSNEKIKVVAYNVLENGLLAGKLNKKSDFPKNDRRSRLALFKGKQFIKALDEVEQLKIKALENNKNLLEYSLNWVLMQENIISAIIGIKNLNQIEQNCSAVL